jgi:hypothetical protein
MLPEGLFGLHGYTIEYFDKVDQYR